MGLFDESDSDNEVPTTANDTMEDEEEDPLEAYMNLLNDNDNATSSNNNNKNTEMFTKRVARDQNVENELSSCRPTVGRCRLAVCRPAVCRCRPAVGRCQRPPSAAVGRCRLSAARFTKRVAMAPIST